MKLFYKKDYLKAMKRIEELEEKMLEATADFEEQEQRYNMCLQSVETMHYKMEDMKKEIKQLKGSRGGFTRQVNKLRKENEDLKNKLADSMTDKYLIKKIRPGKRPNTLKTKVRNSLGQSNIVKNLHKE